MATFDIEGARKAGMTDDQIVQFIKSSPKFKDNERQALVGQIQNPPLINENSGSPFLGNMLDAIGQGVSERAQGLGQLWNAMTSGGRTQGQSPAPAFSGWQRPAGMNIDTSQVQQPSALQNLVQGAGEDMRQQQRQGMQQMQTDPIGGVLRMITGSVPVIGPGINKWADTLGTNPGQATGEAALTAADIFGPKMVEGMGAPARTIGRSFHSGSFEWPDHVFLSERPKIVQMARDLDVPTTGSKALKLMGGSKDPNSFIGTMSGMADSAIQANRNTPIDMMKTIQPSLDAINAIDPRAGGGAARRIAMQNELEQLMYQNGWRPGNLKHPMFDKKYPNGRSAFPLTVEDAQKVKQDTYRLLTDRDYGDTDAITPAQKQVRMLYAQGLKNAIEEKAPDVAWPNDQMHTAIQLKDIMTDITKKQPGSLKNWGKWAITGGGMAYGATAAEASGHPWLGGLGMTGLLFGQAARDPAVASRLGLALQNAGRDPLSRFVGRLPLAGRAGEELPPDSQ